MLIAFLIGLVAGLATGYKLAGPMAARAAMAIAGGPARCDAKIEHDIAFTARKARDLMSVQSAGPSCTNLVATVTIRDAKGHIVFAHAARIDALMDPKVNPIAVNGVKAVLNDYAAMSDTGARAALPDWRAGAPAPADTAPYGIFDPMIAQALYARVRTADGPLLRLRRGRDGGLLFAYLPEIDESEQVARYAR